MTTTTAPSPPSLLRRACRPVWLFALVLVLGGSASAQLASGSDPAAVSDEAVTNWLAQKPIGVAQLSAMSTSELCRELPSLVASPPPPEGTRVNLDDRQELDAGSPDLKQFSYSAVRPGDQLEVVQVTLERVDDHWVSKSVGFRLPSTGGSRAWLQTPAAGWVFALFSLWVLVLLATPSFLRRWLRLGLAVVRRHRGIVIFTMVLLYGMFTLGAVTGSRLPQSCTDAVVAVVNAAVTSVGATEAYGSGNVARAAALTFYQNFVVVTLSVTFSLALLFGIPAYLLSVVSYFVQAIPFGLLDAFSGPQVLFVLGLLLLELTSYFLVVAGGGIFLATLVRKGFGALSEAFTNLALTLPIAGLLLLIGAWYEAAVLLLGG